LKAEIICIGTELLLGQIVDTNAVFLAKELADLGIDLFYKAIVGDNLARITGVLEESWRRSDILILSGGLGPTRDDLTREAVAGMIREQLEFNEEAWGQSVKYFQKVGRAIPESNRRQAMFPKSGKIIPNNMGTAPGLMVAGGGKYLFALPGVPSELRAMWIAFVKPYLRDILQAEGSPVLTSKVVRMVGIGESLMEEKIIDLITAQSNPTIAPYAGRGEVSLRITAKSPAAETNHRMIEATLAKIKARLGEYIFGYDADNLETVIGRQLTIAGWRLALAESCTGGLVAHRITNVPGSSEYYLGGINSYSNQLKINLLGVAETVIAAAGAVSEKTAALMASGIKKATSAEVGLAVTGIAGPSGAVPGKPVGLVYSAVDLPGYSRVERWVFPFDRIGNKEAAAQAALTLLWRALREQNKLPEDTGKKENGSVW